MKRIPESSSALPLILFESLVVLARVGEVINRSDSVNQVIEGALQGKPIVVFRARPQFPGLQYFHPARQGRVLVDILVRSQSAKSTLREMTVRRNKAWENEFSFGIVGGQCLRAGGRVALADRFDLSVVAHQNIADERLRLSGFHGQLCTVDDEQLIYSKEAVGKQQNGQDSCTHKAPSTGK